MTQVTIILLYGIVVNGSLLKKICCIVLKRAKHLDETDSTTWKKIMLHVVMVSHIIQGVKIKIYRHQTARSGLLFMFPLLMCISITIIIAFSKSWVQTPLKSWLFQASVRNCLNCDDHGLLDILHPQQKTLFIAQCCYFSADSVTYKNFNKSNIIISCGHFSSFLDSLIRVFSSTRLPMMEWCWTYFVQNYAITIPWQQA